MEHLPVKVDAAGVVQVNLSQQHAETRERGERLECQQSPRVSDWAQVPANERKTPRTAPTYLRTVLVQLLDVKILYRLAVLDARRIAQDARLRVGILALPTIAQLSG